MTRPLTLAVLLTLAVVLLRLRVVGWGRRPSATELAAMTDPEFAAWVRGTGIGTVTREPVEEGDAGRGGWFV